jgi:hypothetical protein
MQMQIGCQLMTESNHGFERETRGHKHQYRRVAAKQQHTATAHPCSLSMHTHSVDGHICQHSTYVGIAPDLRLTAFLAAHRISPLHTAAADYHSTLPSRWRFTLACDCRLRSCSNTYKAAVLAYDAPTDAAVAAAGMLSQAAAS